MLVQCSRTCVQNRIPCIVLARCLRTTSDAHASNASAIQRNNGSGHGNRVRRSVSAEWAVYARALEKAGSAWDISGCLAGLWEDAHARADTEDIWCRPSGAANVLDRILKRDVASTSSSDNFGHGSWARTWCRRVKINGDA